MTLSKLSRWLLPLSLALNVFLGTLAIVYRPHPPRHGPPNAANLIERIAESLPQADAVILRSVFARHAADLDQAEKTFHAMPDRVRTLLAAPQLDRDALLVTVVANRQAHDRMDDILGEMVVEVATQLSPEGRAALARWDPRPPPPPGGMPPPGGPPRP